MHRLVQEYNNNVSGRDGRPYYNLAMQSSNHPSFRNNDMFNHPHSPTTNRVYPPGSNSRLAGLLASTPSATSTFVERACNTPQVFMNRMSIMQQQHDSGYYNNNGGGNNGQGGMAMMESTGGGYSAQNMRNGHLMPQLHQQHHLAQQQQPTFGGGGVGFSGNGGGVRYHPYHHHPQYPHTPHYQQQHTPQKSPGFLEQLLKNRSGHQMGYYSPYGGRAPHQPPFMSHHQRFPGSNIQGYGGGVAPSPFSFGPRGIMTSGYYPQTSHYHQHQQQLNWGARVGILGGGGHGGNPFHSGTVQNGGGFPRHPNPFYQHGQHSSNNHFLPIIKNEPEEGEQEDQPDKEIQKSETRYRKNHERMSAIMNENCVDCNPIQVPEERVKTLQHHVRLLTDDLNKHKDDTLVVKENCAKRLQDFQEATSKFHEDYQKLCQPIDEDEYNELVDKYYKELKEKMKESEQEATPTKGGGDEVVVDLSCGQQKKEEDTAAPQENARSTPPLDCSGKDKQEEQTEEDINSSVLTPDDDYFDHPLFIDIPSDENERMPTEVEPPPPQHNLQENQLVFGNVDHSEGLATPTGMAEACRAGGGDTVGDELYFEGQRQPFDHNQQQQQMGYSYYTQGSSTMNTSGADDANQMENLLMSVHAQPPTSQEQQIFMRDHHQINTNVSFNYQNQQYVGAGAYSSQHQQQFPSEQYHHHVPPSPQMASSPANMRVRPTEELRDFILDLVRGKYRRGNDSSSPQLQLKPDESPSIASTSSDLVPEAQRGQFQQRRLMSGGGIVEVRRTSPIPPVDHRPAIYDDAATREWINSLTNVPEDSTDDPVAVAAAEEEQDISQDSNNNLQMDLNNDEVAAVEPPSSVTNNTVSTLITKNSKIAEILQSPCLNDSAEEFDLELRQLEEALNIDNVDTAISSMHRNSEDVRVNDDQDDNNVVDNNEQNCE